MVAGLDAQTAHRLAQTHRCACGGILVDCHGGSFGVNGPVVRGDRNAPERNLCAIREVVRSLRLADQRGIGLVMAQAAKSLLALPEPVEPGDPDYVLGVRKETPSAVKKAAYRELVKMYHPDTPVTGNRERYDRIRAAAEALGLAA